MWLKLRPKANVCSFTKLQRGQRSWRHHKQTALQKRKHTTPRQYLPVVQSDWPRAETPALTKTWPPLCLNGCSSCWTWGLGGRRAPRQWRGGPAWRGTERSMWPGPASPDPPPTAAHREVQEGRKVERWQTEVLDLWYYLFIIILVWVDEREGQKKKEGSSSRERKWEDKARQTQVRKQYNWAKDEKCNKAERWNESF